MKVLVVVSALLVVALAAQKGLSQEEIEQSQAVHKRCQEDPTTAVSQDLLIYFHNGVFVGDEKLKLHQLCILQGFGFFTPEGEYVEEKIRSRWAEEYDVASQEKLQKCLVNRENAVETSWALIKCERETVENEIRARRAEFGKVEEILAQHRKCQSDPETVVDENLLAKFHRGEIVEDERLKTHFLCMYTGLGWVTTEGKIVEEKFKAWWAESYDFASQEELLKCLVNKENARETSWGVIKCEKSVVGYVQ